MRLWHIEYKFFDRELYMIITRTPLRISFAGGGSDMPSYYTKYGGAVVSTAISKYIYVTINKKFDDAIRLSYSKTEHVTSVGEIEHGIARAVLTLTNVRGGVEITTIADIPASGTGLGSSSSFTVGLLHALHAYQGRYVGAAQLGAESCHIEIDVCNAPIGKQDQYAAAYGGFNFIRFEPDGNVTVEPLICPPAARDTLERNILLLYTGRTRSANTILAEQSANSAASSGTQAALRRMTALTNDFAQAMQRGDCDAVGDILHEGWELKKHLASGISNAAIDSWYDTGRRAGATGGKILGAGAGGFLLFYAPQEKHPAIIQALPELRPMPINFERTGSQVIFHT